MKRYEFHDLGVNKRGDPLFIPPEAMVIYQSGVGTPIEDMIDNYETLSVTGRELLGYQLKNEAIGGVDGSMYLGANYPNREITIKYAFEAKNDQEFREKYSKLAEVLSTKQMVFSFYDDMQYFYTGTVTNADIPPEGLNKVVSSFTITCNNPFKRLKNATIYHGFNHVQIVEPALIPTVPDEIIILVKANTNHIEVSNGKQIIKLSGTFKTDDKIIIKPEADYDKEAEIYLNSSSNLALLDLDSDFENFTVKENQTITINPTGNDLTLKLRRLSL